MSFEIAEQRPWVTLLVVLLAGALMTPVARAGESTVPYRLAVRVEWGQPRGPESLRAELELQFLLELERADCFEGVEAWSGEDSEADLLLRVALNDYSEEVEYEQSLAQRAAPPQNADPTAEQRQVARLETHVRAVLYTLPQQAEVRKRSFREQAAWRPQWNEDPREEARLELVDSVVRDLRRLVCKGSTKDWEKMLAKVRSKAR